MLLLCFSTLLWGRGGKDEKCPGVPLVLSKIVDLFITIEIGCRHGIFDLNIEIQYRHGIFDVNIEIRCRHGMYKHNLKNQSMSVWH